MTISFAISLKLVSQKDFFLPLRKDILRRICPIELKFSGFVVLSKFCRMNIELFQPLHFVEVMHGSVCWIFCVRLNWSSFHVFITFPKSLCLLQKAICLLLKTVKKEKKKIPVDQELSFLK